MPDEPVPMTATRRPVKSTSWCGHRAVWYVAPAEAVDPVDLRELWGGQATGGHHHEPRRHRVAAIGAHGPARRLVVERRRLDAGAELDGAAEVEGVGDMAGVAQDLRLRGVALGPLPLLFQLRGERVRVVERLDVAPRSRIAVPPPGAADVSGGVEAPQCQTDLAEAVDGVHPGEAGADDHDVATLHVADPRAPECPRRLRATRR